MKIIKDISQDIECVLDKAEDFAKKATLYRIDYPEVAQTYYAAATAELDLMKTLHDRVVALITDYKKSNNEVPVPMQAIYDYLHERFIEKAAAVKNLQDMFVRNK